MHTTNTRCVLYIKANVASMAVGRCGQCVVYMVCSECLQRFTAHVCHKPVDLTNYPSACNVCSALSNCVSSID